MRRVVRARGVVAGVVVAAASLGAASQSLAAGGEPPAADLAAAAQYRAAVPAAAGAVLPGTGRRTSNPLPARIRTDVALRGGARREVLLRLATRSDYGAPQTVLPPASDSAPRADPRRSPSPLRALVAAPAHVFSGGRSRVIAAIALAAATLAAVAAARLRRPV